MKIGNKRLIAIGLGSFLAAVLMFGCVFWHEFQSKRVLAAVHRESPVLQVGRHVVGRAEFREAQNRFFIRWKRNADMLRLDDEERNNRMVEELINEIIVKEYLKQRIKVDRKAVDDYINRYIRAKYPTEEELTAYLDAIGCNKADLGGMVILYLAKLRCFPQMAREAGLTVSSAEIDREYQRQNNEAGNSHPRSEIVEMLLLEKFAASAYFQDWQKKLRTTVKITVFDPALQAYRFFKEQKYRQAAGLYEQVYRFGQQEFYLKRALDSYYLAGDWNLVIKLGNYGSRHFADKIPYYLSTAEGFYHKKQVQKGLDLLKKAEKLAGDNRVLQQMVTEAYDRMGLSKSN